MARFSSKHNSWTQLLVHRWRWAVALIPLTAVVLFFQNCAAPVDTSEYLGVDSDSSSSTAKFSIRDQYPQDTVEATLGLSLTLSVTPSTSVGVTYEWVKDGVKISNTTQSLSIATVSSSDAGQYLVTATHTPSGQRVTARTMRVVTVSGPVVPTAPEAPVAILTYEGKNEVAVLTTNVPPGIPTPALQWQKREAGSDGFADIPGATSTTLRVENLRYASDFGDQYRVVAYNTLSSALSVAKTVEPNYGDNRNDMEIPVNGMTLEKGQRLATWRLSLDMQADGNLALYSHRNGASSYNIWHANTQGRGVRAAFNGEGLVVYDAGNNIIFRVGKIVIGGRVPFTLNPARMILQGDGNMVIYTSDGRSTFSTNTVGR